MSTGTKQFPSQAFPLYTLGHSAIVVKYGLANYPYLHILEPETSSGNGQVVTPAKSYLIQGVDAISNLRDACDAVLGKGVK